MSQENPPTNAAQTRFSMRQLLMATVLLSAGAMLFLRPMLIKWVRKGEIVPEFLWLPAIIFFISLLLYTWSRGNVQGGRKTAWLPFQVGFGLVLLLLIIPGQLREYRARKTPEPMTQLGMKALYKSKDARIRALVLNAAVCSEHPPSVLHEMVQIGLEDPDPMVQEASIQAVEKLTGNQFDRGQTSIEVVQKSLDGFLDAANTKGASEF